MTNGKRRYLHKYQIRSPTVFHNSSLPSSSHNAIFFLTYLLVVLRHVLRLAGSKAIRFIIPDNSSKSETFHWKVELPPYLTCTQCVMQWTYYAGNTWGTCSNGDEAVGCGPQETFVNCADVAIVSNSGYFGPVHNR